MYIIKYAHNIYVHTHSDDNHIHVYMHTHTCTNIHKYIHIHAFQHSFSKAPHHDNTVPEQIQTRLGNTFFTEMIITGSWCEHFITKILH